MVEIKLVFEFYVEVFFYIWVYLKSKRLNMYFNYREWKVFWMFMEL